MLNAKRPVGWALATLLAAGLVLAGGIKVWPYIKYPEPEQRSAGRYAGAVRVVGFEYRGEDTSDVGTVSRYFLGAVGDHRPRVLYNGRESLHGYESDPPISDYFEGIGWLTLSQDEECVLQVSRARAVSGWTRRVAKLSDKEKAAVEGGERLLIEAAVTCGAG